MNTEYVVVFKVEEKWIRTEKLKDLDEATKVEGVLHDAGMTARILLIKTDEEIYVSIL